MQQNLKDSALFEHFKNAGDSLTTEAEVLGGIIRKIIASGQPVNNKAIIIHLINALETADDGLHADVLRRTLEIVMGYTPDDADI